MSVSEASSPILHPPGPAPARPSTVSLVLGSGGARGYAHVGVIQELEAQGFRIASVSGASIGALVGGMYAAGKLEAYSDWARGLRKLDVLRLVDWSISGGFMKGERVIGILRELAGDTNIEDLPIPYTAVAVDLDAQREVWLTRGSLFDAIRSSIAIPMIFRPHRYEGRLLVDGGLLNPVPITPTLRDLTDCTIAVDLNAPIEALAPAGDAMAVEVGGPNASPALLGEDAPAFKGSGANASARTLGGFVERFIDRRQSRRERRNAHPGMLELFARALDTVQESITRFKLAAQAPDLLITIPRNACAFYEFYRADELIEIGRIRTREALARWTPPGRLGDMP